MEQAPKEFFPLFLNVVVPVLSGLIYFAMALYVKKIGPMRTLIAGELTYKGAFWGFLFFGIYLASRPIQILFPHPWPLIINNIREFMMIGFFGPAVFLAMMSFVFGTDKINRRRFYTVLTFGFLLAVAFVVTNCFAIGGSEQLFRVGKWVAHDGLWFRGTERTLPDLMRILFIIRLIDPVILIIVAGSIVLWRGLTYPLEKKKLYDNMPKKLVILGIACFCFALSMLSVGILFMLTGIPNQWWIYYFGALAAGFLETWSLSLPMKKIVQVSEHSS